MGLNDGGTLNDKTKVQVLAVQVILPDFESSMVITVAVMQQQGDGSAANVGRQLALKFIERTGHSLASIADVTIVDYAAISTPQYMVVDEDDDLGREMEAIGCGLHNGDKILSSLLAKLLRTRNHVALNAWPECLLLMAKLRSAAKHFSYGQTRLAELNDGDVCTVKLKLDLSTTRIASQASLIRSIVRRYHGLVKYSAENNSEWELAPEEWEFVIELDAIASLTHLFTTRMQYEVTCPAAYQYIFALDLRNALFDSEFDVVDRLKLGKSPNLKTQRKNLEDFTEMGKIAVAHGRLEFERRLCTNDTEELNGSDIFISERELVVAVLDVRTKNLPHFSPALKILAEEAFLTAYCSIAEQIFLHSNAERERENAEFAAASAVKVALQNKAVADAAVAAALAAAAKAPHGAGAVSPPAKRRSGFLFMDDTVDEEEMILPDAEPTPVLSELNIRLRRAAKFRAEASRMFSNWKKFKPNWRKLFPSEIFPADDKFDMIDDLLHLPLGILYRHITKVFDTDQSQFGLIPFMATSTRFQIGALLSEGYCERVLSHCKLVMPLGRTLLSIEELEMCVILRMNQRFMQYMRSSPIFRSKVKEKFGASVVRAADFLLGLPADELELAFNDIDTIF
jgi:hypothetical protein